MLPKKMPLKDLSWLIITVMLCSLIFATTLAYAGAADEALSVGDRAERMGIVGILVSALTVSIGINVYLIRVFVGKFTTMFESAVGVMKGCADTRLQLAHERELEREFLRDQSIRAGLHEAAREQERASAGAREGARDEARSRDAILHPLAG